MNGHLIPLEYLLNLINSLHYIHSLIVFYDYKVMPRENFLLLMALGYATGFKTKFENPKASGNDTFVMNQLTEEELALMYAIAIADSKDTEIVNNDVKVADIAMEYANTGIIELKKMEESSQKGNRIKKFQAEIHDFIEDI